MKLDKGCPVQILQSLLGNKDYHTTAEVYLKLTSNDVSLKQIHDKYF
jgi:site-specific recombinase XerD